jgi:undecaprenyl-diphosphatase
MMSYIESIILGVVQGLTEFLPVSSSGHLVLMQSLLGLKEPMVLFDVLLHVGTVAAVFVVYRAEIKLILADTWRAIPGGFRDFKRFPQAKTALMIILANVPTAIIGLTLEHPFEKLFSSTLAVGVMLLVTGCILFVTGGMLFATKGLRDSDRDETDMTVREALIIGIVQGFAITPGISRSGITIVAALFLGIKRESAARFSFLLSIPAILGALVLKLRHTAIIPEDMPVQAVGMAVSFTVGVAALIWLINVVKRGKLVWFSWYVWTLGLLAIAGSFIFR